MKMNDRYMYAWSDESGKIECTKENTKVPSKYWQWVGKSLIIKKGIKKIKKPTFFYLG